MRIVLMGVVVWGNTVECKKKEPKEHEYEREDTDRTGGFFAVNRWNRDWCGGDLRGLQ